MSLSSKGNCVTIGVLTQEHLGELEGILKKASEQLLLVWMVGVDPGARTLVKAAG